MTLITAFRNSLAATAALLALIGPAHAELFDRGNGLIYDSALNITWMQDWNYAKTSGYDADGLMNWNQAMTWADTLAYGGYSDWRLPIIVDTGPPGCDFSSSGGTDCGYNVQTASGGAVYSEMAHLYYVTLGNGASSDPGFAATAPFVNAAQLAYWSGTEYAPDINYRWAFITFNGSQNYGLKRDEWYAMAVRSGDVAAVASGIPEPETYLMMLAGLGALGVMGRRRPR